MSRLQSASEKVALDVRNIGGIDETSVTFSSGVTALTGRNATNRTSLLQAIIAALGGENASLKGGSDEGHVELSIGDETYTRTLTRTNGNVVTSGAPYLDNPELAELFAFLLESNPARRAVERGDDLRELIMRPVDTDAIQGEIEQLEDEKRDIDADLEELDSLKRRLPDLESERTRLQNEIEETEAELADKQAQLDAANVDIDDTIEEKTELEDRLEELRDARSELEDVRFRRETEQESLSALREDLAELEEESEELPSEFGGKIDEIESEIRRLRNQSEQINSTVTKLQTIIQFNEDLLEGTGTDIHDILAEDDGEGSITDELLDDAETVVCWTCGSEVERDEIETTLDSLRDLRSRKIDERNGLQADVDELTAEKDDLNDKRQRREEVRRRRQDIEDEIDRRESKLTELDEEREELTEEIQRLEREVENLESEEFDEMLDRHREVNQLEFELDRQREELEDVETEIADVEDRLADRERLEDRREEIREELQHLRSRIDRIEADAVEEFNDRMEEVLEILEYENLDRIWIERTETEVREGRRKVTRTTFDLHVIRSTQADTSYEDTVDHLSESEREVTGLVFALAGYLVHDVHDVMPFILLDSLEAIDAERIALLIDYLHDYAPYLVVALLPEDASAIDAEYQRVTDI